MKRQPTQLRNPLSAVHVREDEYTHLYLYLYIFHKENKWHLCVKTLKSNLANKYSEEYCKKIKPILFVKDK
jgi:hypothetical protein